MMINTVQQAKLLGIRVVVLRNGHPVLQYLDCVRAGNAWVTTNQTKPSGTWDDFMQTNGWQDKLQDTIDDVCNWHA